MTEIDRKQFIGGSDIGAIIGVSRFQTPLDIYLKKIGEMPETGRDADPQREKVLKRGKRLEPVVLEMLTEEHNYHITARNLRYIDAEHDFLACEVDAESYWDDEKINIEVKTVHPFAAGEFGEEGTDEIDVSYAAQAMWGLMITGRKRCIFAVLIGADNLLTYEVMRDEDTIKMMRQKAISFWNDNVLAHVPPAPIDLQDVYHLFGRATASSKEATSEIAELVADLRGLQDASRTAAQGIDEVKFKIGAFMVGAEQMEKPSAPGKHVLTLSGQPILTIALQHQDRIDNKALKEKYPEVAADCMKQTSFFTFSLKRSKK